MSEPITNGRLPKERDVNNYETDRAARRAATTYVPREMKPEQMLADSFNNVLTAMQAAWIEWKHGKGAESAMEWIHNQLEGPGNCPDENEPWGKDAQAWWDSHKSDVFPDCPCGRPSNTLSRGHGYCSWAHMKQYEAPSVEQ